MLTMAIGVRLLQGRAVVVAADRNHAFTLKYQAQEVARTLSIGTHGLEIITVVEINSLNLMNLQALYPNRSRDTEVFWDHHTIETLYSEPLYQLHRFDKEEDNDQNASRS